MQIQNIFTNRLGLARSVLALSLIITLIFNSDLTLFPEVQFQKLQSNDILIQGNIFFIFQNSLLVAKVISIIILLFVISGILPQVTGVLHWYICFSFYNAAYILEGGDQLMAILTFLLIPITILDNRKNHWSKKISNNRNAIYVANFFLWLIKFQIAIVYLQAGVDKILNVEEWRNGTALYYYLNNSLNGGADFLMYYVNLLFSNHLFLSFSTWLVVAFEILLSMALIFSEKFRKKLFIAAVFFHLLFVVFLGLVSFFIVMYGVLIFYLLPFEKEILFSTTKQKI